MAFCAVSDNALDPNDFHDVWDTLKSLSSRWEPIGISLRLSLDTLSSIKANHGHDCERCLQEVLSYWLRKSYNYKKYGNPSWRKVCVCAKEGGKDSALAEAIARQHEMAALIEEVTSFNESSPSTTNSSSTAASSNKVPSSSQVYVPTSPRETNFHLLDKLYELQINFADNIQETRKYFESCSVSKVVKYMETHVVALLTPQQNKPAVISAVREEFCHVKTISQLFVVLEKYVSWFNYEFIIKLVRVFLPRKHKLQRAWTAYAEKLKDYFINSDGLAIECVDAVQFGLSDIPGTQIMVARVARTDYTLTDLFFFYRAIPEVLKVPNMRLYFCSVSVGCLHLNYLIPDYLYSILFPLNSEQLQLLANIGVVELRCGDQVYSIEEMTGLTVLSTKKLPIDMCDPLLHENTSTPLHEACWRGLIDEVRWLIDTFGYKTFQRGLHGWKPLHSAAYDGHIDILQLLINQYECDPTVGDDDSVTSLHMASFQGHLNIVKYLIDTCGIDPDITDSSHNTALLYSAMGGHCNTVEFLLNKNCNSSHLNYRGASLSLLACKSGQLALVHKLEALDLFLPDATDYDGRGILHYSCMSDSLELVQYLSNHYKQLIIDVKDRYCRTPLHYASWYASSTVVNYIISIKGNEALLKEDNNVCTSLHCLCCPEMTTEAGIVFSKFYVPCDSMSLETVENVVVKCNVDFFKHKKRNELLSSLFCNLAIQTQVLTSLFNSASLSGNKLLLKTLEEYGNIKTLLNNETELSLIHCAARSGSLSVLSYLVNKYKLSTSEPDYTDYTPLHYACQSGSINTFDYLINTHHSDPNITDNNGINSLHHSCCKGHYDLTQYLIEIHDTDIRSVDKEGRTVLHHGAWSGNLDLVEYLIDEHSLSHTEVSNTGCTILHYATRTLKLPLVKRLITTYGVNPQQVNNKGRLPIHYAALAGDVCGLEYLVKSLKCDLTQIDNAGCNIMHLASAKGHAHLIKHIVDQYSHCSDLLYKCDHTDHLPLHWACRSGNSQLVTFLIDDMKCDITAKNKRGSSCVTFASLSGNLDLVQLLVDKYKLNPLDSDKHGYTSLHVSVQYEHIHIMEWISQKCGVDIAGVSSLDKYTLVHTAATFGQLRCVMHLVNTYHCDINATTISSKSTFVTGYTPLHKACEGGHIAVVRYLTSLPQCNISAKTSGGSTALHLTCKNNSSLPILKYLVENYSNQLDLCAVNDNGIAPIHLACIKGNLNIVQYIIEHSPLSLELPGKYGYTPILTAVYFEQFAVIRYLLSQKCNTSIQGCNSPLHISVERGNLEIMKCLVDHLVAGESNKHLSAVLSEVNNNGHTIFQTACINSQLDIFQYLCHIYPEGVYALDDRGCSLLHAACQGNSLSIVQSLTEEYYLDPTLQDEDGVTCLHLLAEKGNAVETYEYLVFRCQTTPIPFDNKGRTPLHYASLSNNGLRMVIFLIENFDCHPDDGDFNGYTSVHAACEAGNLELVMYFLTEINCKAYAETFDSKTLLYFASKSSNLDLVRFLVEVFKVTPRPADIKVASLNSVANFLAGIYKIIKKDFEKGKSIRIENRDIMHSLSKEESSLSEHHLIEKHEEQEIESDTDFNKKVF